MIHTLNKSKWLMIVCGMLASFLVASCSGSDEHTDRTGKELHEDVVGHADHDDHDDHYIDNDHNDGVELSDAELEEFSIELLSAVPGSIEKKVVLTGEIVANPGRLAHIVPRFPGIVKKVRKRVGDSVRSGEVLAVIESNESLAPYKVTSLISGKIIEMHLTLGELVSDNSHAIVVADFDPVWAELSVHQKELEQLAVGQKAELSASNQLAGFSGEISWISPMLSEERRTATARVVVANPDGAWRPGLFIQANVTTARENVALAVPKTAIEIFEGETVLFIKSDSVFVPRSVELGQEGKDTVEILSGLAAGDVYVSKGGFTLKAELEKSAFGDGHAH
ncbi:MAG: efflux RND transporter periplasmic adaptor subunit [Calditrichia bacterium]